MRQPVEIKHETRQINSSVTVMFHDRKGKLTGLEPFCALENAQTVSPRGVSLAVGAFCFRPSLSRNMTGKPAISACRSRLRSLSLPLSKSLSAEAHLALSACCVFSDVSGANMDADATRFQADKQQHRYLTASRPRDGVTSRMTTQPRTSRGLVSHTLKNVAARLSVVCGPETNCCGSAASSQI